MPDTPILGEVYTSAINFAPTGYMQCAGQLLPITQNTALFSLLGTTYGGNGVSNFALPDLRGRVAVGSGQGVGLANYIQGAVGGVESVTLTANQMPSHAHVLQGTSSPANDRSSAGTALAVPRDFAYAPSGGPVTTLDAGSIQPAGGSQAHENRQPYLVMFMYIAMVGIFPSH